MKKRSDEIAWSEIADMLLEGPMTAEDIASKLGSFAAWIVFVIDGTIATFEFRDGNYDLAPAFRPYWEFGRTEQQQ